MTAHPRVIAQFTEELLKAEDLYYVPQTFVAKRFDDKETMGNYHLPTGIFAKEIIANDDFRESLASPVGVVAGYSYEPPVQARLMFHLYRPRFADSSNVVVEEIDEEQSFNRNRY
jgi:hypothetical protein